MTSKLWFITDGVQVISVFLEKDSAEADLNRYRDDPDFDYYYQYSVMVNELDDYPDEYDLAQSKGLIE